MAKNNFIELVLRSHRLEKTRLLNRIKDLNRSVPRHIKAKPKVNRKAYLWDQTMKLINEHLGETNASNEK